MPRTLELWKPFSGSGLRLRVTLRSLLPLLGERVRSRLGERVRERERGVTEAVRLRIGVRDLLRV